MVQTKRTFLKTTGVGLLSTIGLTQTERITAQQSDTEASVTLEDQQSDGESITVAAASSPVDAELLIIEDATGEEEFYGRTSISAGESVTDIEVELDTPIEETQPIKAILINRQENGEDEFLARDTAIVTIGDGESQSEHLGVSFVEADPESGFQYPYYLFTPASGDREEVPILVESNNTGTATDDFDQHRQRARQLVEGGLAMEISRELSVPLLVPVFPRPRNEPVDGTHYTHQLDRETLMISEGPLERIDLQLLRMVEHAKDRLSETPYTFSDQIMLNGFSASGNFVDRFTVLHPERVLSVTVGGLNGMALLPLEEAKDQTLRYHVGIADVEDITGQSVDIDALDDVNQFLYMGGEDSNDTLPYDDAWTSDELRNTAREVYGEDMIQDRFPFCYQAYEQAGVDAQFKIYDDAGHTPRPAYDDIIEFHRRSLDGDDVSDLGEVLGTKAVLTIRTDTLELGQPIEFDASESYGNTETIEAYTWDFGDGNTAAGETVTHTYESAGQFAVTLEVISGTGATDTVTRQISVSGAGPGSESAETTETTEASETTDQSSTQAEDTETTPSITDAQSVTNTDGSGFGVGTGLAGLGGGGIGYLLQRWRSDGPSENQRSDGE